MKSQQHVLRIFLEQGTDWLGLLPQTFTPVSIDPEASGKLPCEVPGLVLQFRKPSTQAQMGAPHSL